MIDVAVIKTAFVEILRKPPFSSFRYFFGGLGWAKSLFILRPEVCATLHIIASVL